MKRHWHTFVALALISIGIAAPGAAIIAETEVSSSTEEETTAATDVGVTGSTSTEAEAEIESDSTGSVQTNAETGSDSERPPEHAESPNTPQRNGITGRVTGDTDITAGTGSDDDNNGNTQGAGAQDRAASNGNGDDNRKDTTQRKLAHLKQMRDNLSAVVEAVADANVSLDTSARAITALNRSITAAEAELANNTSATNRSDTAAAVLNRTEGELANMSARIKAEIAAGLQAKLARKHRENNGRANGNNGKAADNAQDSSRDEQGSNASDDGTEDEASAEEQIRNADSLEEALTSAKRVASTLDSSTSGSEVGGDDGPSSNVVPLYRSPSFVGVLLAFMAGSGFLYYRMHGGYDVKKRREKKWFDTDDED